jgi:rhamnulokinase
MAAKAAFLAADFGAESGRVMAGRFDGRRLSLEEIHRFPNGPIALPDGLHWDVLRQYAEMKTGFAAAVKRHGRDVRSLGIDTWGVDFGLLDARGDLLGNPYHYRDARTQGIPEKVFRRVPWEQVYRRTGIQFMSVNTLYQLAAMAEARAPALDAARTLLYIPDLFNYWLTGRACNEWTIASTSQCLNTATRAYAGALLRRLGIPPRLFPEIVDSGTILGRPRPSVAEEIGSARVAVVAPGTHDTASAVAAVPAGRGPFAYLSSGTWSLMGVEIDRPVITATTRAFNLTNEGGVCGTIRLLRNIMGLWLVQESRRTWRREGADISYAALTRLAARAPAFAALVNPDDAAFLPPGDMPARIRAFCRKTGQKPPADKGALVRCALESLALTYRRVLGRLERVTGQRVEVLHIVGGGSQNALLNQFAADAIGRPVVAGPVEATAAGNVLVQLLATKEIRSLAEGREVIRRSFPTTVFQPRDTAAWDAAYERFEKQLGES